MPTLRVGIWKSLRDFHYTSRFFFSRGRTSTRLRLVTGSNANPSGWHMENPKVFHYNITRVRARVREGIQKSHLNFGHFLLIFQQIIRVGFSSIARVCEDFAKFRCTHPWIFSRETFC